jgi:hypothetical protein
VPTTLANEMRLIERGTVSAVETSVSRSLVIVSVVDIADLSDQRCHDNGMDNGDDGSTGAAE